MWLSTKQQTVLQQFIQGYISDIIAQSIWSRDSVEMVLQKRDGVLSKLINLCAITKFERSTLPEEDRKSYQEFYKFWSLIHFPQKLASELHWVKSSNMEDLSENERQILSDIQSVTKATYIGIFNGLIDAIMEVHKEQSSHIEIFAVDSDDSLPTSCSAGGESELVSEDEAQDEGEYKQIGAPQPYPY